MSYHSRGQLFNWQGPSEGDEIVRKWEKDLDITAIFLQVAKKVNLDPDTDRQTDRHGETSIPHIYYVGGGITTT